MAKRKNVKPLFELKGDFIDSLENFCQAAIMLHQQVQKAVDLGAVDESVKPLLVERLNAFRAAMISED